MKNEKKLHTKSKDVCDSEKNTRHITNNYFIITIALEEIWCYDDNGKIRTTYHSYLFPFLNEKSNGWFCFNISLLMYKVSMTISANICE